jgi:hypothetical protein
MLQPQPPKLLRRRLPLKLLLLLKLLQRRLPLKLLLLRPPLKLLLPKLPLLLRLLPIKLLLMPLLLRPLLKEQPLLPRLLLIKLPLMPQELPLKQKLLLKEPPLKQKLLLIELPLLQGTQQIEPLLLQGMQQIEPQVGSDEPLGGNCLNSNPSGAYNGPLTDFFTGSKKAFSRRLLTILIRRDFNIASHTRGWRWPPFSSLWPSGKSDSIQIQPGRLNASGIQFALQHCADLVVVNAVT